MSRYILLLLILKFGFCQNLVVNPSFENRSGCPVGPSEMDKVNNWDNAYVNIPGSPGDTCSTSDYYHSCNFLGSFGVDVPDNIMGSEAARTGNAYCGIITYEGFPLFIGSCTALTSSGWREYLVGELSLPLIAGNDYCVSFYVSLADKATWGTGDFHVYLTNSWSPISCASVSGNASHLGQFVTPQLRYDGSAITQKNGWTLMQWDYTATGGENRIIIGNFDSDGNTTRQCANSGATQPYAYYFIDDVSVVPGKCSVLPVNVIFKAFKLDEKALISWKILNYKSVARVKLYRSYDNKEWEVIEEQENNITENNHITTYLEHNKVFYKLEVEHKSGEKEFYHTELTNTEQNFVVFPNPVKDKLYVEGNVKVKFYNIAGELMKVPCVKNSSSEKVYDFSQLPSGYYFMEVLDRGQKFYRKIIKK